MEPVSENDGGGWPAAGERLAGNWIVERVLGGEERPEPILAEGLDSGRAMLFVLPDDAPDPELDDRQVAHWGVARHVLRDPRYGRVVVDEIPEGRILAERLALGVAPAPGLVEDLTRRVRDAHRQGFAHGRLGAECVILGAEGPAVAGWGLRGGEVDRSKSRDLAWLSRLAGMAGARAAVPAEDEPTAVVQDTVECGSPTTHRLQAAILSSHLPTLRQALEEWRSSGGAPDDPAARRAADALQRLEKKIAASLDEARARLAQGDPLGAVAPCREAIRLGAEADAEPLLRDARRQARRALGAPCRFSPRLVAFGAAGALAAGFLVFALVLALRPSAETARLREEADNIAAARGHRAAVLNLLARRERGDAPEGLDALLADHVAALAGEEQQQLARLHKASVAQGARPYEADRLAEEAVAKLTELSGRRADAALRGRVREALLAVDRAAALYRGSARIGMDEAARAVEFLLAADAAFAGEARP